MSDISLPDELWTTERAAKFLGWTEPILREKARLRLFPEGVVFRLSREYRFNPVELKRWLVSGDAGSELFSKVS